MKREKRRAVFVWLFFVDGLVSISTTLIGQQRTLGFDPIFYNPVLIAAAALVFMLIETYLPFLVLYKFVFETVTRRFPRARPYALCWALLILLLLVSVTVDVLSFGRLDVLRALVPVGLAIINVGVFFRWRVWQSPHHMALDGQAEL